MRNQKSSFNILNILKIHKCYIKFFFLAHDNFETTEMTILVKGRPAEISDVYTAERSIIRRDATCDNLMWPKIITNSHDPIQRSNYTDNLKHSIPPIIEHIANSPKWNSKISSVPLKERRALKKIDEKASKIWEQTSSRSTRAFDAFKGAPVQKLTVHRSAEQIAPRYFNESMFREDWRGSKISTQAYFEASINVTTTFHGRPRE